MRVQSRPIALRIVTWATNRLCLAAGLFVAALTAPFWMFALAAWHSGGAALSTAPSAKTRLRTRMVKETESGSGSSAATLAADAPPPVAKAWPRWQCIAFRFLLLYYVFLAFPGPLGSLASTVAGVFGVEIDESADPPWSWLTHGWQGVTNWMDAHGLAPYEVIHQRTGSGDTGHDFARVLAVTAVALLLTAIWSLWPRAGRAYPRVGRWLHLIVRFDLAFTMFGYGFAKFYGGQFGMLSLSRLTQEIGDTWPMSMVGTFMQASKPYELFGGCGEVLAGLLLFQRRTALLGAFVAIGVMTNVCALNWLYGVPVKLYSLHLLLYAILLLLPFRHRLWALFCSNGDAAPVDLRVVTAPRAGRWLLALGSLWVLAVLVTTHLHGIAPSPYAKYFEKSQLYGLWVVETMRLDGVEVPITDAQRWRDFAIDTADSAWSREAGGARHFFEFHWDDAAGTAQVKDRSGGDAETWTGARGTKTTKVDPPLLLHSEERGKKVDGERRTLVLTGKWQGKQLELQTVQKVFRLQTGFRLRQELPDFW